MNSVQFNIFLGISTVLGFYATNVGFDFSLPLWLLSILCLNLYVADYWAFLFKLQTSRAQMLKSLSNGNPNKRVGDVMEPGCMIFYAFLMRMVFRIVLAMIVIMGFTGSLSDELNGVQIGFMIAIVLFELFNMLYSLYESHIFKSTSEDDDDSEKNTEEFWNKEAIWRKKMFLKLNEKNFQVKVLLSNVVLFFMAMVTTHLFWDGINNEFIDFIIRTDKYNESVSFAVIAVLVSCLILCFFFLMPIRLAFWIQEKMIADTSPEKLKYRLSLVFAGITVTSPTLIQLIKTFVQ